MASVFGHVALSSTLGLTFYPKQSTLTGILIAGFCAFAPDLDVLAFRFGIPYDSPWGHRGWTHSIVFALFLATLATCVYTALAGAGIHRLRIWFWFFFSTLSHPLLDMLTNGGRGCALWWPFSDERLFFPWRPILVSPMSVSGFIGEWGLRVLLSEAIWIGLPCLFLCWVVRSRRNGR